MSANIVSDQANIPFKRESTGEILENTKRSKIINANSLKVVQEVDVGITEYINKGDGSCDGFFGTIKQRYSDFLVNEISTEGNVIHLRDKGINLGKSRKEKKQERRKLQRHGSQDNNNQVLDSSKKILDEDFEKTKMDIDQETEKEILESLSVKELNEIKALFESGDNMETETVLSDKAARGNLHQLLRRAFKGKLETITTPENTFRIALAKNAPNTRRSNPMESINHVDENGVVNYGLGPFKNFLHFTVYKENRETMEAASIISKFLRIPIKNIRYAGTKDRRGVTCQRFCINKGKVARVSSLNKGLKNMVLGGFSYSDSSLGLGDLDGNEFVIAIRSLKSFNPTEPIEEVIENCFSSLASKGFINYYGMQRFGTFSVSTHALGIHLLNENWEQAVDLILSEQDIVAPDSVEARRIWSESKDPRLTLSKMPRKCSAECAVLNVLAKEQKQDDGKYAKSSYFKSIMSIPRNLRIMYGHAYQSFIWNRVVSKRIELYGLDLVVGDLVLDNNSNKLSTTCDDEEFEEDVKEDIYDRAKALTKEDLSSGKYTIYDVVLPTPGFDVIYPQDEKLKSVYKEVMAVDGLDPDKMSRRIREFSLAGSYRNIVSKPENLTYQIVNYENETDPLLRTDLELLDMKENGAGGADQVIDSKDPNATKKAVILKMKLRTSSYATMALREFMKADTSRLSQNLNVDLS